MTDDLADRFETLLAEMRQRAPRRNWIDDYHQGEMLLSHEAAESPPSTVKPSEDGAKPPHCRTDRSAF